MMENKNNSILIAVAAALLLVVLGLCAYVAYDKGIIFNNKDNIKEENEKENNMQEDNKENNTIENVTEENNTQENNTQVNNTQKNVVNIVLVDPTTEEFNECSVSIDIDSSKYLQKNSDGTYEANLTLENVHAALVEYDMCDFAPYYGGKVRYNVSAKYGKNNMIFSVLTASNTYGTYANINNIKIIHPYFYTFNNEYLVVTQGSTNTTGPAINDGVYIFDKNGNKVFESKDITLDIYDENRNLKKEIKYKKICEGAWYYDECENIISGEIKYDTVNKKFIVKEETVKNPNYDANFIH